MAKLQVKFMTHKLCVNIAIIYIQFSHSYAILKLSINLIEFVINYLTFVMYLIGSFVYYNSITC